MQSGHSKTVASNAVHLDLIVAMPLIDKNQVDQ